VLVGFAKQAEQELTGLCADRDEGLLTMCRLHARSGTGPDERVPRTFVAC